MPVVIIIVTALYGLCCLRERKRKLDRTAAGSQEHKMKKLTEKKRLIKFKHRIDKQIDCHSWATKMEIHRLISGKADTKLTTRAVPQAFD